MRNKILAAAATAAALMAAPAFASPVNQTDFSANVQHDDLDLGTERGVARLDDRLRSTIRRACANGGRDSASIRLERQCRESALASAERQVRFAVNEARRDDIRLASSSGASDAATPGV